MMERSYKKTNKSKFKLSGYKTFREFYLILNALLLAFPFYYMFLNATKSHGEILRSAFSLPERFPQSLIENLQQAISGQMEYIQLTPYFTMLLNTVFLSVCSLFIMIVVAVMAGYALGRYKFKLKLVFLIFLLIVQTVPFFGYIMPLYLTMDSMHLTDKLMGVIPVYVAVSLPTTIILLQGFYKTFPVAIEEAALIDGCNEFKKMLLIVTPMSKGAIFSMCVVNFMGYWNEFAIAGLLLSNPNLRTLNVGIFALSSTVGGVGSLSYVMIMLVLSALPNFIFFTIFQKNITQGVSLGGVKG